MSSHQMQLPYASDSTGSSRGQGAVLERTSQDERNAHPPQPTRLRGVGKAPDRFPGVISWELTLECNLGCRHCGSLAGRSRGRILTVEECLVICDQLSALAVKEVHFTGGEPLLRPGWQKIASRLRDLNISVQVFTNGSTLTPRTVTGLVETGIKAVSVGLDGLRETHDYLRASPGLFRKVMDGLELLRGEAIPVTVITTVHRRNLEELPILLSLLCKIGVKRWQLQPIMPLGHSALEEGLPLGRDGYLKLAKFIDYWSYPAHRAGLELLPKDGYGNLAWLNRRRPSGCGCPVGRGSLGITSDGKVKGCLAIPDEVTDGDLRQENLRDIWFQSGKFLYNCALSQDHQRSAHHKSDGPPPCHGCHLAAAYGARGITNQNLPYCCYKMGGEAPQYRPHPPLAIP